MAEPEAKPSFMAYDEDVDKGLDGAPAGDCKDCSEAIEHMF